MTIWTAHLRAGRTPVLVREGFSAGALLFGPVWLLAQGAWIPALLDIAAWIAVGALTDGATRIVLFAALAVGLGLFGRDLVRWSLERRGFVLVHVVAARDDEAALARLLHARPDLKPNYLPAGSR